MLRVATKREKLQMSGNRPREREREALLQQSFHSNVRLLHRVDVVQDVSEKLWVYIAVAFAFHQSQKGARSVLVLGEVTDHHGRTL